MLGEKTEQTFGGKRMKNKLLDLLLIFVIFCIGMYLVPLQMIHSDFSLIPGDLNDSRLNNYFLEHGYKWMTGQEKSFWNAPFFYPAVNTMAFSENHLGTLPLYALFRFLHFDRETSYQLWFLALFALNYFSCAWILRKFSINALGASAGAFIFTFSLPIIAQTWHSQLFPRFMIPIAFYFAFKYLEKPEIKAFALICLSAVIQLYSVIYMGFFLILGLLCLTVSFFLIKKDRMLLKEALWGSHRTHMVLILFTSAIALLPLLIPYIVTALDYKMRSWEEISSMLPRVTSYFYPASGSLLWNWLRPIGEHLPMSWEHAIFIGLIPLIVFIILPLFFLRKQREPMLQRGIIIFLAIIILIILTLYLTQRFSFYRLVILLLPGARAIRAVTRIILFNLFPFSLLLGIMLTKLTECKAILSRNFVRLLLSALILFAVILDQKVQPEFYPTYSKIEAQNRSKAIERLVLKKSSFNKKDSSKIVFAYMPRRLNNLPSVVHIDAMMAAQNLNMATVNGHSSNWPHNYWDFYTYYYSYVSLKIWKEFSQQKYCRYYADKELFKNLIVIGQEGDNRDNYSYTIIMKEALPEKDFRAKITLPSSKILAQRNSSFMLKACVKNVSSSPWGVLVLSDEGKYQIRASYRWLSANRSPLGDYDYRVGLPHDLRPGETTHIEFTIQAPAAPGKYFLEFDLVQELVAWFHDKGNPTAVIEVTVL